MTLSSGQQAPPGYYPDPAGSGLLRWWHGSAWTDDVVHPAPPMPPFGSVTFGSPAQAPQTFGTSVVPAYASTPPRRNWLVAAVAGVVVLCLALAAFGAKQLSAHDSKGRDPAGITAGPAESSRVPGSPLVTPAEADAILQQYWPVHEQALVERDPAALRNLDTGAMAAYEPNAVQCGCTVTSKTVRPLLDTQYYIPRQTAYPAFFAVAARTTPFWTEVLVFTKAAPGKPWLVSENSGVAWTPPTPYPIEAATVDTDGYAPRPTVSEHARATKAASQLARLWKQTKVLGAVPAQHTFDVSGQLQAHLIRMAAHKDGGVQANGLKAHFSYTIDPHDPLVEFAAGSTDLACQAVRVKVVYTGATRTDLVFQDPEQHNWGKGLRPGVYRSIVSRDIRQTCFVIPDDSAQPIRVLDQEGGGLIISVR